MEYCTPVSAISWKIGTFGTVEERLNRADIIEVFEMAKVCLQLLWNLCLSCLRQNISEDIHWSWLNTEVLWKWDTTFSPKDSRWYSLDQQALDVDSVICFKNHLHRLRNTRMGFFVDWRLINPLAAQVYTGVAIPGKWAGKLWSCDRR